MDQIPNARSLPIAQTPPARHARPATHFLRQHLRRNAAAEHEQNSGEASTVWHARPAALLVYAVHLAAWVRLDTTNHPEAKEFS